MTLNPQNNGSVYETLSIYDMYFSVSLEQLSRRGESSHHLRRRYSAWQRGLYSSHHGLSFHIQKQFINDHEAWRDASNFGLYFTLMDSEYCCLGLGNACFTHWDTHDAMTETCSVSLQAADLWEGLLPEHGEQERGVWLRLYLWRGQ